MRGFYAILWLTTICISSIVPVDSGEIGELLDIGHIIVYIVQTILWAWYFDFEYTFIPVSIASTPVTELLQLATPWRNPCLIDILNNMLGVCIGIILVYAITLHHGS
ncbi:MAG: hypothetical protein QW374_05250 [Candidatus Bathyarchaeia archaeon]|nr:hypothetical protein [Candidatus Bathyarchaeota archaeon]